MTILILGATGRTGKHLLKEALDRGYKVHALVRDTNKLATRSQNLVLFEGNPDDPRLLEKAASGCTAVLSVLNVSRKSDFPWSSLRSPKDLMSATIKVLLPIAEKINVKRVVVCSAWGTLETKKQLPGWFRWLIDNSNVGVAYADHERQEKLLRVSQLDWTIVLPVGLSNSKKEREVQVILDEKTKPRLMISRLNLARFMLDCFEKNLFVKQSPVICEN